MRLLGTPSSAVQCVRPCAREVPRGAGRITLSAHSGVSGLAPLAVWVSARLARVSRGTAPLCAVKCYGSERDESRHPQTRESATPQRHGAIFCIQTTTSTSHISVSRETLLDGHSVVAAVGERVLLALEGLRAYVQPTRRLLRVREADDVELDEE